MKRFREGYNFPCGKIGMTSRFDREEGLVIIPIDPDGQLMFRFYVEEKIDGRC